MKYILQAVTWAALTVASSFSIAGGLTANAHNNGTSTNNIIIKYKSVPITANAVLDLNGLLNNVAQRYGVYMEQSRRLFNNSQLVSVRNMSNSRIEALLKNLNADSTIEYAEMDVRMYPMYEPNDPQLGELWGLTSPVAGVNAPAAWDVSAGSGVRVAVLDTGYRPHADLVANLVGGYDFVSSASIGNDGDGRDGDASDPGDGTRGFFIFPGTPSSWHGTHVAGTIAATADNAEGVVGLAFDSQVVPVRVLGKGGGSTADIADAIVWASGGAVSGVPTNQYPARVINMSLGGRASCDNTTQNAINEARANGAVVVVAAGNSNANVSGFTPASCSGVVAVAALDQNGNRASFSNYGSRVDIAAPGVGIISTLNSGRLGPEADNYKAYSGTSMASPHVAAVAALILSVNPGLTPDEVEQRLKDTARAFNSGSTCNTSNCGAGMLDAAGAVGNGEPVLSAPKASFAFNCDLLECAFTDQSSDSDGSVVAWSWDFGDGNASLDQNPAHVFAENGNYDVELTVTDNDGLQKTVVKTVSVNDGVEPPIVITLSASKSSSWFSTYANLTWSGATSDRVDIYRNGSLSGTTTNDGSARTGGLFANVDGSYVVCEAGTNVCSNESVIN